MDGESDKELKHLDNGRDRDCSQLRLVGAKLRSIKKKFALINSSLHLSTTLAQLVLGGRTEAVRPRPKHLHLKLHSSDDFLTRERDYFSTVLSHVTS